MGSKSPPLRKRCRVCRRRLALSRFSFTSYDGVPARRGSCNVCERRTQWAQKIKKRYGITVEEYAWLWHAQRGRCAICEEVLGMACVDHDHVTLVVRGLLCNHCNRGVGHFRDCPNALASAIRYLSAA